MSEEETVQDIKLYNKISDLLAAEEMNSKKLSPSALMCFLGCEMQYFFRYVKGWRIAVKSGPLALGSAFHAGAEEINRQEALYGKSNIEDAIRSYNETWEDDTDGVEFKTEKEKEKAYQMGLSLLEKYLKSDHRKKTEVMTYRALRSDNTMIPAVEMELRVPVIDLATGEELAEGWEIHGYIDVIKRATGSISGTKVKKGELIVADYKTSRSEYTGFKVEMNLQLLMYAYAIRYLLRAYDNVFGDSFKKDREDWVGIICLTKKAAPDKSLGTIDPIYVKVTDEEIEYLQNLVVRAIERIEAGVFLPTGIANHDSMCAWCEYKFPCKIKRQKGSLDADVEFWWHSKKKTTQGKGKSNRRTIVS